MQTPDFERAKHYALERLEHELPPTIFYHSLFHTRDDVVPAVEQLAELEGIQGEELLCLQTAAYFHDLGHIENSADHEERSARIAREVLPDMGYTPLQIELIAQLIMSTKLPQNPVTLLEEIIVDADMDSLGRNDFLKTSLDLKTELEAAGLILTNQEWYSRQRNFLRQHRYFTASARHLRDEGKQRNIELLEQLIAEVHESET